MDQKIKSRAAESVGRKNSETSAKFLHIITIGQAKKLGLKSYFTGLPCKYGHVSERSMSRSCKKCSIDNHLISKHGRDDIKSERIKFLTLNDKKVRESLAFENKQFIHLISKPKAKSLGMKLFFTGEPCRNRHVSVHSVSNGCMVCAREKSARYKSNPENRARYNEQARRRCKTPERRAKERDKYHSNVEKSRAKAMAKYWKNRDAILLRKSIRGKERLKEDPEYASMVSIRNMVSRVLRLTSTNKASKSEELIGYTRLDLRRHLESQFTDKMNWGNWGAYWEIDHITPVSVMVRSGVVDPRVINALPNLIPIPKYENRSKSNKELFLI